MAYPASTLITNSWYLSGIVARNLQIPTADQINDGLNLLNAMLAVKSANVRLIPYFSRFDLTAVVGQEMYFIPNLVSIETFTFFISNVRYSTLPSKRIAYWGSGRIENINSLPYQWNFQRVLGGGNLFIYFTPQQNYPMEIWGKFALTQITSLTQDLLLIYDLFYIEYLRYALASQMAEEYNITLQPHVLRRLTELESIILTITPPDLSMQKISTLGRDSAFNYADVNIGRGYRP